MRLIITLLFLTLFCAPTLEAQNFVPAEVEISQEKIKLSDGSIMYVHQVKKGQTLFSIAKKYQISVPEIMKCNAQLPSSGQIKAGDILYIPVVKNTSETTVKKEQKTEVSNEETVESLDRKRNRNFTVSSEKAKYKKHKVKWYESIDDIAEKYRVSVSDIMSLNNMVDRKVKSRMVLLIPDKDYRMGAEDTEKPAEIEEKGVESETAEILPVPDTDPVTRPSEEDIDTRQEKDYRKEFKFTLILPFKADPATMTADRNYMDFYSGSLMAVKAMKDQGMKIRMQVIDLEQYGNSVHNIIATGQLDNSSFILGPVSTQGLSGLLSYCEEKNIPLISPMDPNAEKLADVSSVFIQAVPSTEHIKQQIFDEYARDNDTTFHTFVFERSTGSRKQIKNIIQKAELSGTEIDSLSYNILQGRDILGKLESKMVKGPNALNKVLVASENQAFVSDIIRNLNLATLDEYNIEIYGMPNWKNFQNIDVTLYHDMNLNLYIAYNVDYTDHDVNDFIVKYRSLYHAEPTPFSFQGFDLTRYFLDKVFNYQEDFTRHFPDKTEILLQSNIRFKKTAAGGLVNVGSKHIIYEDNYNVREIR